MPRAVAAGTLVELVLQPIGPLDQLVGGGHRLQPTTRTDHGEAGMVRVELLTHVLHDLLCGLRRRRGSLQRLGELREFEGIELRGHSRLRVASDEALTRRRQPTRYAARSPRPGDWLAALGRHMSDPRSGGPYHEGSGVYGGQRGQCACARGMSRTLERNLVGMALSTSDIRHRLNRHLE